MSKRWHESMSDVWEELALALLGVHGEYKELCELLSQTIDLGD